MSFGKKSLNPQKNSKAKLTNIRSLKYDFIDIQVLFPALRKDHN